MVGEGQLPQKLGCGVRNFSRLSGHVCETTPHGGGDGLRLGQLCLYPTLLQYEAVLKNKVYHRDREK